MGRGSNLSPLPEATETNGIMKATSLYAALAFRPGRCECKLLRVQMENFSGSTSWTKKKAYTARNGTPQGLRIFVSSKLTPGSHSSNPWIVPLTQSVNIMCSGL